MKAYKFDTAKTREIDQHFKNMKHVLAEVTVTYSVASELLQKHAEAMQVAEVDPFRKQLHQMVQNAEKISALISEQIQRLADTSEGIALHLDAVGQQAQSRLSHTHPPQQQTAPVREQQSQHSRV